MRVILYGSSLLMRGVEASLKALPGLELAFLHTDLGKLREQACRLQPNAVVVEAGTVPDELSMALLREVPGLALVTLDPECSRVRVLSGRQAQAVTTRDLVRMIETWKDSTPARPLWQAHLDRLSQFASAGLTALGGLSRRQRLAFAFAAITLCAVLGLLLSPAAPQAGASLVGTAAGRFAPDVGFGGGVVIGALLLGLGLGWKHRRSQSMIHNNKMVEGGKTSAASDELIGNEITELP